MLRAETSTRSENTAKDLDPLSLFLTQAASHRLLTAAGEVSLAKRIERATRPQKRRLIESNLRLVVAIANRYGGRSGRSARPHNPPTNERTDEMRIAITLAAAIAALAHAPFAVSSRQTTAPNVIYTIPAVLTDKTIELTHTEIPRGAVIRYLIVNRGTRPYALQISSASTRPIPPKGRARLQVIWNDRGRFVFRTLYRGAARRIGR